MNNYSFISGGVENQLSKSKCTLLKIRAGIFLKPDCLSTLTSFLYDHNNIRLVIYAYSHDSIPVKDLVTSLNVIGQYNVLLDLPEVIVKKINTISGSTAVEDFSSDNIDFRSQNSAKSLFCINSALMFIVFSFSVFFYR